MKRTNPKIGAICVALIFFIGIPSASHALPLAETIFMIPEYDVELTFRDEVCQAGRLYRKDAAGLGFGAADFLSVWLQFEYLSQSAFRVRTAELGDMFLKAKFYIGDYARDQVHIAFLMKVRFPLGKNAYASDEWLNMALGKYEFKLGPVFRFDLFDVLFMHVNIFYTFKEGSSEDFWGGFYLDITKQETWEKAFGFNPKASKTFFNVNRLKNDYASLALAWNTGKLYPVVPYFEIYGSLRVSRGKIDGGGLPIEAAKYNVLLMAGGVRYFIKEAIYLGIYTVQNPLWKIQPRFIRSIYGIELSLQL